MNKLEVVPQVEELANRHRELLDGALAAVGERGYWTPFAEMPQAYGEDALERGRVAFEAHLGKAFGLEQAATSELVGAERSPFGFELAIRYPRPDVDGMLAAMHAGTGAWREAGVEGRAGVVLEILTRLNARSAEIAQAVMHTTGQAPMMAFQAGGPHAQDRALEAVAVAVEAMRRVPAEATWVKPQGKREPLRLRKRFTVVPRGIALVIGCNTFPTWNGYPGLFASLVCGNPVVVKPSSRAVLPLAITVAVAREVLAGAGFSPELVTLAVSGPGERLASELALRPEVRIVDYTGSSEFGDWLQREASHAVVLAEKAGINTALIDSTDDYEGMLANLAFTLSLYSGQMCTTTQNLLIPRDGIATDAGHKRFDEVGADLAAAIERLLGDPARAVGILGAIANPSVSERLRDGRALGEVVLDSERVAHPDFPDAEVRTPLLVAVDGPEDPAANAEQFGPIALLVPTRDTSHALEAVRRSMREHGAITSAVYSTDAGVLQAAHEISLETGTALSCNLTGQVFVNQSAAFSDYHGTPLNPAANAALTDLAFVAPRFAVAQAREHVEAG